MLKVETFLGCFKLETGGLVIGWFYLISSILSILTCILLFIAVTAIGCENIAENFLDQNEELKRVNFPGGKNDAEKFCEYGAGVFIAVSIIGTIIGIIIAYISFLLIKGVKDRNHSKVKPFVIYAAIMAILALFKILSFTRKGFFKAVFYGLFYGYSWLVTYSLFNLFRSEAERGPNSARFDADKIRSENQISALNL